LTLMPWLLLLAALTLAQIPPGAVDVESYTGLHRAALRGDAAEVARLLALGADPNARDGKGGAPLDHVNNLGWTAVIEAVVLGDGGARHVSTLRALVEAGANVNITDRQGVSPLAHARARGYAEMVSILEAAGGR
jgi:ankyrin repeat protein